MAGLSLGELQFFKILLPGMYEEALRLPAKFARELGARRDLKLRLAGEGMPLWDVDVFAGDEHGDMYLGNGWKMFAGAHDLRDGYMLVFRYDGGGELAVTVFDLSTCQKLYVHAGAGGASGGGTSHGDGRRSLTIAEPSHFAVTLRACNFGTRQNQYLNVPVEFQEAHGYVRRRRVELQMGGRSWMVTLKRSKQLYGDRMRTSFKYGWRQFCIDNGLGVGDTCFFRVIREGGGDDDEDEEWEEEEEDDDHVLKVEVRKKDGTFVS